MIKADVVLRSPEFLPETQNDGDAGGDLRAYIASDSDFYMELAEQCESAKTYLTTVLDPKEVVFVNGKSYFSGYLFEECEDSLGDNFVLLKPGQQKLIEVGLKLALYTDNPSKVATMLVVPRSGLACKHLVGVANSPGVVDQGYRNWVGVCLENRSQYVHIFTHGSRIGQALFVEVENQRRPGFWNVVDVLLESSRGLGGFGSTGI